MLMLMPIFVGGIGTGENVECDGREGLENGFSGEGWRGILRGRGGGVEIGGWWVVGVF